MFSNDPSLPHSPRYPSNSPWRTDDEEDDDEEEEEEEEENFRHRFFRNFFPGPFYDSFESTDYGDDDDDTDDLESN